MVQVKDEEGRSIDDPKKNPDAALIPETTEQELLDSGEDDLLVAWVVVEHIERADSIQQIQVINELRRGQITAVLNGESNGTVIRMARSR
jgi:molybdenum storage protein